MATSIKLDPSDQERLRVLAEVRQRTSHFLMKEAIHEYLGREEARESFKQEALAAWSDYQETGLHLTGAEVDQWLDTWGTDDEAKAPTCHR